MKKAIFLDKDGTLIENVPYNIDPDKIRLYEDVPKAMEQLKRAGFHFLVITNQPGVALGYFKESQLTEVKDNLVQKFKKFEVDIEGFYYCPHHREGTVIEYAVDCTCRKPFPGMILNAAKDQNIDLSQSWMIGDILNDVEAGNRAGCKTILINNGNETEWIINKARIPNFIARNMGEAADIIVEIDKEYLKKRKCHERATKRPGRHL